MLQHFLGFAVALAITAAAIPLLARLAPRLALTDAPGPRKVHSQPIPRVGGIAMAAGIFITVMLLNEITRPLQGLMAGLAVLLVFGTWDDRAILGYRAKFAGQFLAIALCLGIGGMRIETLGFGSTFELPALLSWPLTFLFLLGVTNAVNLADGLDGLAGGMALLCLGGIALLAGAAPDPTLVAVCLIQAGAILGFLRYNTHPARVFMGDAGSQILGLSLGALSIIVTQGPQASASGALPLLLIGVPLIDTLAVMASRIRAGQSPFVSDRNHLHHRLLALGLTHGEAVTLIYVAQFALLLTAYALRTAPATVIVGAFLAATTLILGTLRLAQLRGWRRPEPSADDDRSRPWRSAGLTTTLRKAARWMMLAGVALYVGVVLAATQQVGRDLGVLCAIMLVLVALSASRPFAERTRGRFERIAAYVCLVLIVYLDQISVPAPPFDRLTWAALILAGAGAVLWFVFSDGHRFETTPLDILVVILALVVPALPGLEALPRELLAGIPKAVVLLYVFELLIATPDARPGVPRLLIVAALLVIAIRGIAGLVA